MISTKETNCSIVNSSLSNNSNETGVITPKPDATRSELLGDLIRQRDQRERIGAGLPLYLHLTLNEQGVMTGTYDQIGEVIGEKGNTIRNWVATMKANEIITCKSVSKQVEIALTPDHMRIAQATDRVVEIMQASEADPWMTDMSQLYDNVQRLGGTIELNIRNIKKP